MTQLKLCLGMEDKVSVLEGYLYCGGTVVSWLARWTFRSGGRCFESGLYRHVVSPRQETFLHIVSIQLNLEHNTKRT